MPFGFGYGRGFGRGFGFRGSSPPWPYVGRGRGGLPRCSYYGAYAPPAFAAGPVPYGQYGGAWADPAYAGPIAPGAMPYGYQMGPEEEIEFLREEANAVKAQLDGIEARIKDLEGEEK